MDLRLLRPLGFSGAAPAAAGLALPRELEPLAADGAVFAGLASAGLAFRLVVAGVALAFALTSGLLVAGRAAPDRPVAALASSPGDLLGLRVALRAPAWPMTSFSAWSQCSLSRLWGRPSASQIA